jgi:hypothetical protein
MKTFRNVFLMPGILFMGILISSCEDMWNHCVDGNGDRISETRQLESFERIQVSGDFDVQIDTGRESSAVVKVDENLLDLVATHVSGNKLIIETRNNHCLRPSRPIEVTVSTPAISEIYLEGSGNIACNGIRTDELNIILEGSGQIDCYEIEATSVSVNLQGSGLINTRVFVENLAALLEGSGEISMNGETVNSDLTITGSGHIKADQVISDVCYANISGSGQIDTRVNNVLDVTITGSGTVYYRGDPTVTSNISGSGKVVHQ